MEDEKSLRAWAYVRDTSVHPSVVIGQMSRLLKEAEARGIPVVGASQDMSSGMTLERMGLLSALRAMRTGYANAVITRDVSRLSVNRQVLLKVTERLQDYGAVLICTAEDAHASLQAKDIAHILRQRADSLGLGLPWIEKGSETR
ncbi:MAG: recombinase family protein [Muribaculaceae bacterium]|nr:recombinase family protein [Muribaculaceae bacterium]